MLREYTCIICPNGCDIRAQIEEREDGSRRICSVEGAACPKGRAYVEQELTDPPEEYCHICIGKGRHTSPGQREADKPHTPGPDFRCSE